MGPVEQRVKILVVDDDVEICEYMETFLQGEGFAVRTLTRPDQAPEEVRRGSYHVVILDLMMPQMTGIEVLKEIRKTDSDVAIIVATGYPSLDSAVASIKLDATDYLKKPFRAKELRDVIARVLRKKGISRSREETFLVEVGKRIRACRREKGLRAKDVARRAGVSQTLLSILERGGASTSLSALYRVATALEMDLTEVVKGL